jgi:hypothetical protein
VAPSEGGTSASAMVSMEAQGREREREREREEMRRVRGDPLRRRGPGFRVEEELVRLAPMQLGLGGQEKQPPIAARWVGG